MFFGKKRKDSDVKCPSCDSKINKKYDFCPYCGNPTSNQENEARDFGMLGKHDSGNFQEENPLAGFGITDKLISSLVNNLAKSLDKQFTDMEKISQNTEVKSFPNGIKIRIGPPINLSPKKAQRKQKNDITDSQIEKISSLPRAIAKSSVKRINDKVIYNLETPGVDSTEDVFISKLESGYEVKAIGKKKIYVNSIPINLPLKRLSLLKDKLAIEFVSASQDF